MLHHVFLSYSHFNPNTMQRVRDYLMNAELSVWTDEGIEAGTPHWRKAVQSALDEAGCVVLICSPAAKESEGVQDELDYAKAKGLMVYPILAHSDETKSIPFGLIGAQRIDIRKQTHFEPEMGKLAATILKHLGIESQQASTSGLEEKFHKAMIQVYKDAKRYCYYNASYFIQMISERGALATAKYLITTDSPSEGFTKLWECNRLDLTVEAVALNPIYAELFTEEELRLAKERLKQNGFDAQ